MDISEEESAPLMIRDRGGSQRSSSSTGPGLQVHLHFIPGTKEATAIQISSGHISAEDVCIQAGKKCGEITMANHYSDGWLLMDNAKVCKNKLYHIMYFVLHF